MIKRKLLSLFLVIVLVLSLSSPCAYATDIAESDSEDGEISEETTSVISQDITEAITSSTYGASIMQGNTQSPSDCHAIYNGLSNYSYSSVTPGWTWNNYGSFSVNTIRASSYDFINSGTKTLAYYSGHGAKSSGYPVLNASATNSYGLCSSFDVSQLLNVKNSTWRNDCLWQPGTQIKVLMLATCHQLDSSIVKYYARIMRASGIRAIAGYNEPAPIQETDKDIANMFMELASYGNSVWYSWEHANWNTTNGYQPWAVLVYTENYNQYYRIPGFPGNTYTTPSYYAPVYRYADFLDGPAIVPLGDTSNTVADLQDDIPYEISIQGAKQSPKFLYQREVVDSENETTSIDYNRSIELANVSICSIIGRDSLSTSICMSESVKREEVDTDRGVIDSNGVVVENVFTYYNTYKGIKVLDNYVKIGVDRSGTSTALDKWYSLASTRELSNKTSYISAESAANIAQGISRTMGDGTSIVSEMAAYYKVGDNVYRLCYEVIVDNTPYYIDAVTGVWLNEI